MTPSQIISLWPSAEVFSDDLGLAYRSHGRVMKVRNRIPKAHWDKVLDAAQIRQIPLTVGDLEAAHAADHTRDASVAQRKS